MEKFIQTSNNMGYMSTYLDDYAKEFISLCNAKMRIFEAGAAFGVCTIPVLGKGTKVVVNDLSSHHLDRIWNECPPLFRDNLVLAPGPIQECHYEPESFDGIFTSRMLHLLKGEDIEKTVANFYKWLKPGGKLVAVVDTPFLKCYAKNLENYEARKAKGEKWPGMIYSTEDFKHIVHNNIPDFINFIDLPTLERVISEAKFTIEKSSYISQNSFPSELKFDGRESAGIIALKP
ncbi:MAG: hypothetical protein K0R52_177 [Alphaproteobacteria bacterium]|jgi:SAM-dependent methyltransferase|nr:hypothetical protein [Alphaproteobacteria bacterium]